MTDREIMEALLRGETLENPNGSHMRLCADEKIRGSFVSQLFVNEWWTIKPKPKFTWDQALAAMREGKKVRREAWNAGTYFFLQSGVIMCRRESGINYAVFTVTDFAETDYSEVVE